MARLSVTGGRGGKAKARKASQAKGRKTAKTAPNDKRRRNAVWETEVARLKHELKEALAQQTATSEVLKVISSSMGDLQPVFDQMLEKATGVCSAEFGLMGLFDGDMYRRVASYNVPKAFEASLPRERRPDPDTPTGIVGQTGQVVRIDDLSHSELYLARRPPVVAMVEAAGARTLVVVPMLRDARTIGAISIYRKEVRPFSDRQVELLKNFASQAVIAIENARLFNETQEALERQTATADILKVIASSPTDLQPVFAAIAERSNALLNGLSTAVYSLVDGVLYLKSFTPVNPTADAFLEASFPVSVAEVAWGGPILNGDIFRVADTEAGSVPQRMRDMARMRGWRSVLYLPLLSDSRAIGAISVTRTESGSFADHHVELLRTFAAQAVIAIENARLFNETQEALERQTATAGILNVIASSPDDVQPVFEAIVEAGLELFPSSAVMLVLASDGIVRAAAIADNDPKLAELLKSAFPVPLTREFMHAVAIVDGRLVDIPDAQSGPNDFVAGRRAFLSTGHRAITIMPMMRGDQSIGALSVVRRMPGSLSDRQLELLKTLGDQAVIAIENTRLFKELRDRTDDLSESLQQQTATAEVLKVISRSAFDLDIVMNTLTRSAAELCGASMSALYHREGDLLLARGISTMDEKQADFLRRNPLRLSEETFTGRAVLTGTIAHIADTESETSGNIRKFSRALGYKAVLILPLMREGRGVGALALARNEVGAFTPRQIELVQTFADQAVIAIENVRLFDEVQAKTRDLSEALTYQTGTSNILSVIASSPTDVAPVLQAIVKSACELCGAYDALVRLKVGDELQPSAHHGPIPASRKNWHINRNWTGGRSVIDRKPVHVHDVLSPEGDEFPETQEIARQQGYRTSLSVPLLHDGESMGAIVLRRIEVHPFSDKQIALLQTFADQAVIAIGNVRMFEQVQQRTNELSQSLDELRTAQERLIQTEKLASLGQLTAGIAHEIKNPLNFVNNFSALSAELTDELNDVLRPVGLERKVREEVDELTGLLKDNLQKVVQHGKRADSIVKNMLLHSREGSGEHRSADINALVEESLNLAYHGARAEKPAFNITLRRDFDPDAGAVDLYPQEIMRALLNVISNGFYAATKRKSETTDETFEPVLGATTRNLGNRVEIRIRDNGTGIPSEVNEKIFNPFFTTKPAGEGTGLGLSMSHDIVVKQHGGKIDVETEPGVSTEFIITLPRNSTAPP
jgi:two-component system, NtrC family, sensor kinase